MPNSAPDHLIPPHGGHLVDLFVDTPRASDLKAEAGDLASWDLTDRQLCDLELLATGAFSPLTGYHTRAEYDSVVDEMRLSDGTLWPIPITLDVDADTAALLAPGACLALCDPESVMLAVLHVTDVWKPDKLQEALRVLGSDNPEHPAVAYLLEVVGSHYVGGRLEVLELPSHFDFKTLRMSPAETRARFAKRGWTKIVAFQTRNPMHRAHLELTIRATREVSANLLIHPVVGMTKPGDIDHFTRVRAYQAIMPRYPANTAELSLLPLAMRIAGPREAVWHAIIRKNYGCTHFFVGRDHAGPGNDLSGEPFYEPYEAQELLAAHQEEIGIEMVPFKMMVYLPDDNAYTPIDNVAEGTKTLSISGTELRSRLADGREIPKWFSFPKVVDELRQTHPPRSRQGFTVFFTGLSGSGKSTVAKVLQIKLLEMGGRAVTLLDGDIVRKNLSSELGFSKEHRDLNIKRIGYVASEITKNGGIAICAPIAPYDAVRRTVRSMIEPHGGFNLVHVSTPLEVCEQRDRKGLYAKARAGIVKKFTGISDPYEEPGDAEVVIDTSMLSRDEAAQRIILHLETQGFIEPKRD